MREESGAFIPLRGATRGIEGRLICTSQTRSSALLPNGNPKFGRPKTLSNSAGSIQHSFKKITSSIRNTNSPGFFKRQVGFEGFATPDPRLLSVVL